MCTSYTPDIVLHVCVCVCVFKVIDVHIEMSIPLISATTSGTAWGRKSHTTSLIFHPSSTQFTVSAVPQFSNIKCGNKRIICGFLEKPPGASPT